MKSNLYLTVNKMRTANKSSSSSASSSRESTPVSQGRAGFVTPKSRSLIGTPKSLRKPLIVSNQPLWKRILGSNCYFILSILSTLLFTLVFSSYYLKLDYLNDGDVPNPDRPHCPKNAICTGNKVQCVEGADVFKGVCVKEGTDELEAKEIHEKICNKIDLSQPTTVTSLKDLDDYKQTKSNVLIQAIEFCGYSVEGDVIIKRVSICTEKIIILVFLVLSFASMLASYFVKRTLN